MCMQTNDVLCDGTSKTCSLIQFMSLLKSEEATRKSKVRYLTTRHRLMGQEVEYGSRRIYSINSGTVLDKISLFQTKVHSVHIVIQLKYVCNKYRQINVRQIIIIILRKITYYIKVFQKIIKTFLKCISSKRNINKFYVAAIM